MYYYHTFWKYCSISFIIIVLTLQLLQCSTNKEKFTSSNFSWKLRRVTTPIDLQTGLMNVKHLNNNYGMLFDFGKNDYHYLWMKNTLIPLEIDNRISKAVISYNNISNPLFNIRNEDSNPEGFYSYPIAIGGQQIQISVKMNIPIKATMQPVDSNEDNDFSDLEDIPSVPSLSFFYNNANSGVGSNIIHQGYDSVSTDSLTWYYSLIIADGDNNDGDLDLVFTAKDRSGNDVEMFENTDILIHDAQYTPEDYEKKKGWGHSCYTDVINMAIDANVKNLWNRYFR